MVKLFQNKSPHSLDIDHYCGECNVPWPQSGAFGKAEKDV